MNRLDGAARVDLGAGRQATFSEAVVIEGVDWSGDTFTAQVAAKRDPLATLATITISAPSYSDGATRFTMSMPRATVAALPFGTERGDDAVLEWDLIRTTGSARSTVFYGTFTVYGAVTA